MCPAAAERSVSVDFRQADLNAGVAGDPASFDAAVCISVLLVLTDPPAFLARVHELLRPDGLVLLESVRWIGALSRGEGLGVRDRVINRSKVLISRLLPNAVRQYTPAEIAALLTGAGFEVVETRTYDATFTVLGRVPGQRLP